MWKLSTGIQNPRDLILRNSVPDLQSEADGMMYAYASKIVPWHLSFTNHVYILSRA